MTSLALTLVTPDQSPRRKTYWEYLGHDITSASSYNAALETCELSWSLAATGDPDDGQATSVVAYIDGMPRNADLMGRRLVFRDDTWAVLGLVGRVHENVDNHETFATAEILVQNSGAKYLAGGEKNGGRNVFMLLRPATGSITLRDRTGATETIEAVIHILSGHGGAASLTYEVRTNRARNNVTVSMSLPHNEFPGIDPQIRIRHTKSAHARIEEAREIVSASTRYITGITQVAQNLIGSTVTAYNFEVLIGRLWKKPEPPLLDANAADATKKNKGFERRIEMWTTRRDALMSAFTSETFAKNTAWAAYVTIAEYLEWGTDARSKSAQEAAADRAFEDKYRGLRAHALALLMTPEHLVI